MNEHVNSLYGHAFGKRVRFTADDVGQPLSHGLVEGLLVDIASTSGGNFRFRIRTDVDAPQGGGKIERIVYSNAGNLAVLESLKPAYKQHHSDCPMCREKLSSFSPNGFDIIYECPAPTMHHRHMIRGISGEYITMRPLLPSSVAA